MIRNLAVLSLLVLGLSFGLLGGCTETRDPNALTGTSADQNSAASAQHPYYPTSGYQ